jgi:ankyrin repeat protein
MAALYHFIKENESEVTALINETILTTLLKNGANINTQDNFGQTALHIALTLTKSDPFNIKFAESLIKHNADVNIQDTLGDTPLHVAILFHNPKEFNIDLTDVIKLLIPKTNLTLKNNYNERAEDIANKFKKYDIVTLLNPNFILKNKKLIPQPKRGFFGPAYRFPAYRLPKAQEKTIHSEKRTETTAATLVNNDSEDFFE